MENSVVRIFHQHKYNEFKPSQGNCTGFCMEFKFKGKNKHIITNAHCAEGATDIFVTLQGSSESYKCKILEIIYECEMCVLGTIEEEKEFWDLLKPIPIGKFPGKSEKVWIHGFPQGEHNISVVRGIISRVQKIMYYDLVTGMTLLLDIHINSGNSGSPVVNKNGELVGIAFASEDKQIAEGMGYIVPINLVKYVIDVLEKKKSWNGLPVLTILTQPINDDTLISFAGLKKGQEGVLVTTSHYENIVDGDIITHINNIKISKTGMVMLKDLIESDLITSEMVAYQQIVSLTMPGEKVKVTYIHRGKEHNIDVEPKLYVYAQLLYKRYSFELQGLIFKNLYFTLLYDKVSQGEHTCHLETHYINAMNNFIKREIIILDTVVSNEYNRTFPEKKNAVLISVNDINIESIKHLNDTIRNLVKKEKFLIFKFENIFHLCILDCSKLL